MTADRPLQPKPPFDGAVRDRPPSLGLEYPWRHMLETSGEGVWDWDVLTGLQTFSSRWKEMLGYADHEVGTGYQEFFDRLHPDDIERLELSDQAQLSDPAEINTIEFRMRCKDGTWKWILSRILVVLRDEQRHPLHVTGAHTDISDRKAQEAALQDLNQQLLNQSNRLETTLKSISQGILLFDTTSRVVMFNPRVCELLGVSAEMLSAGTTVQALCQLLLQRGDLGPECAWVDANARAGLLNLARGGSAPLPGTYLRETPSGQILEVKSQVLPDGAIVRTFTDVSAYVKSEAARRELNELLDVTQDMARVGGWAVDFEKEEIFWTEGVFRILELSSSTYTPTLSSMAGFFSPASLATIEASYADGMSQPTHHDVELQMVTATGRPIWVKSMGNTVWKNGQPLKRTSVLQDITERKNSESALRDSEERWKLALESTGDGMWDWHIQSGTEYLSAQLLAMYGLSEAQDEQHPNVLDGRTHPDDLLQLERDRADHFEGRTPTYVNEHRILCSDGSWKWILSRGMVITRDPQGLPLRMIGTHTDITARKASEALVWKQAHFDTLTGLPNRRMLRDRLEHEIQKNRRDDRKLAILFIDLDHFKEVNDTLGHDNGDLLLIEAALRIKACVRDTDTVARMGGDEFTVLMTELPDVASVERTLQSLLHAMSSVFQLGDEQVYVSASIGITIFPLDGNEVEDLYKNADQALYVAKGAGRNQFSFFTPSLQEAAQSRVRLTHDLRSALGNQQFQLVYQPIVDFSNGEVYKAEALLRWNHPTRGLVSPADFIPIAESSGLIIDIGDWVLKQAMEQIKVWRKRLSPQFQISVNKSPIQFQNGNRLHAHWHDQLVAANLPGDSLVVEITEGLLLETSDAVIEELLALRDAGIGVSLDDFGTGYSALSYLQKFDIDYIKIDQSFVRHLIPASTDLALCKAIIVMAHELGIKVVAEGVETQLQRDLLIAAGCDFGQGYLFARPMSAPDFEAFMASRERGHELS
ncbi:EAL domain-containing protein [Rhodoferax sp. PAMC 29310]|uniref:EAL domain-containing protein n=1 Tax=Rhodoferax sp. PAMC 29310 TaxID=2822760 RepID=UPI001B32D665|nr:EAL domain-containing protein [Rhodoferax sp. PAMC 29310]